MANFSGKKSVEKYIYKSHFGQMPQSQRVKETGSTLEGSGIVLATTNVSSYQRSIIKSVAKRLPDCQGCHCHCCSLASLDILPLSPPPPIKLQLATESSGVDTTRGLCLLLLLLLLGLASFCGCVTLKMLIRLLGGPSGMWHAASGKWQTSQQLRKGVAINQTINWQNQLCVDNLCPKCDFVRESMLPPSLSVIYVA